MKSLWGNLENITSEVRNPKEIIEGQASFFNNTEGNLAFIEVKSKKLTAIGKKRFEEYGDGIQGDFIYSFELQSKYLAEYTYEIFAIYYGIKFYPICIQLSAGIENELETYLQDFDNVDFDNHRYKIDNEEIFIEMLRKILSTNELGTIIRNINLLAREQIEAGDAV